MLSEDLVDKLFDVLDRSRFKIEGFRSAMRGQRLSSFSPDDGHAFIAFDTNVLKLLRLDLIMADEIQAVLKERSIELIVPGQTLQELWNNHSVFAREQVQKALTQLGSAVDAIGVLEGLGVADAHDLGEAVAAFRDNALASISSLRPYEDTASLTAGILDGEAVYHVPRVRFYALAQSRFANKTPPGFSDAGKGLQALGDFYVWADFLAGCSAIQAERNLAKPRSIFVTNETKVDWRSGDHPHPLLCSEYFALTGGQLDMLTYESFKYWIRSGRTTAET